MAGEAEGGQSEDSQGTSSRGALCEAPGTSLSLQPFSRVFSVVFSFCVVCFSVCILCVWVRVLSLTVDLNAFSPLQWRRGRCSRRRDRSRPPRAQFLTPRPRRDQHPKSPPSSPSPSRRYLPFLAFFFPACMRLCLCTCFIRTVCTCTCRRLSGACSSLRRRRRARRVRRLPRAPQRSSKKSPR